jgi:hypothetical protein
MKTTVPKNLNCECIFTLTTACTISPISDVAAVYHSLNFALLTTSPPTPKSHSLITVALPLILHSLTNLSMVENGQK